MDAWEPPEAEHGKGCEEGRQGPHVSVKVYPRAQNTGEVRFKQESVWAEQTSPHTREAQDTTGAEAEPACPQGSPVPVLRAQLSASGFMPNPDHYRQSINLCTPAIFNLLTTAHSPSKNPKPPCLERSRMSPKILETLAHPGARRRRISLHTQQYRPSPSRLAHLPSFSQIAGKPTPDQTHLPNAAVRTDGRCTPVRWAEAS